MAYVDGFVLPVPLDRLEDYRELAESAAAVFREHGALSVVEAKADDVTPGEVTSFPRAVQMKEGETVIFAYVTYFSREHRDEVVARVSADPRMKGDMDKMPFDAKRMFWGGFEVMVSQ